MVFHQGEHSVEERASFTLKGGRAALREIPAAISRLCATRDRNIQTRVPPATFGPTLTSRQNGIIVLNADLTMLGTRPLDSPIVLMQGRASCKGLQLPPLPVQTTL